MRADIIFLACSCFLPVIFGEVEKKGTTFVPTREWQTVKKGTPIPAGLHIRHNFETGVTEAKLMDNEETEDENSDATSNNSNSKSLTLHPEKAIVDSENEDAAGASKKTEPLSYSIDELKARLKKLKQDEAEASAELNNETMQTNVKQKFRDYETLKKELKALEINITTDSDLLSNYFEKFQSHKNGIIMGTLTTPDIQEVLDILYNLEYLLHHVDNAMVFTDMQGMTKIISPCLNGTNNEIKAEALRLLGAAVQSNPKVQMKALQTDFVQTLLHILSTNNKVELKSRCLFALSALIRQFPVAQKVWIDHGGLQIFGNILIEGQLPIQIKIVKLINDLLVERKNLQEITDTEQRQQRTKAYAVTDMEKKLLIYEYCNHLTKLMTNTFQHEFSNDLRSENYEFLEVVSESMIITAPICKSEFGKNKNLLFSIIRHLLNFYQNLDSNQEQEQDENEVVRNLTSLIEILQTTVSEIPHEEL